MLLTALLLLQAPDTLVFNGRANQIRVPIPRIEAAVTVDGRLDEPVWQRAARLTGFSQYQPVDGRPAEEPTEVLVWYGPDAVYFGIIATEIHGDVVRATRANRDNIASEDHVQILLDTGNDRQLAYLFGVNPLGVQQDGIRSAAFGGGAGGFSATGGGFRNINPLDGNVDLNPDFVWESRGRVTPTGYEVEIRIPFKSLRYQATPVQDWGLHVLRRVQHSGYQDTWAPAVRANANFLAQSGSVTGLHDMRRGLVLEVAPTVTARLDGTPGTPDGWQYDRAGEVGGDVRWGIRQDLTLNGTVNPDFSQVEADIGQVLLNERFALFYPEKRPFFLDGLELFDTPSQLIYTRRIVAPSVGAKVAGKLGGATVATLVAADDRAHSWNGGQAPLFGVARLRREIGSSNALGAVLTAREDGADFSRLAAADLRLYHSRLYYVELQAAQSWRERAGTSTRGALLKADWDRTGRQWGFHYTLKAIGPDFDAAAGFVNRTGVLEATAFNRLSFYGQPGAFLQTWTTFFRVSRLWDYDAPGDGALEGGEGASPSATLRGGWQVGGSINRDFFSYDPALYAGYAVLPAGAVEPLPFEVPGPERNQWSQSLRVTTPTFRQFSATASVGWGEVPIFREAAPGRSLRTDVVLDLRPSQGLRTTAQLTRLALDRVRDGSRFSTEVIPRLKVEYQLSPAIFLRFVGQYTWREQADLVDREGRPILLPAAAVIEPAPSTATVLKELRVDWLFSYRPTPGTLFYLGYGATKENPEDWRVWDAPRRADGFFLKGSYLVRF